MAAAATAPRTRARQALAAEQQRVADYHNRYERANAAFAAEPDAEQRFLIFQSLPGSVQIPLWRKGYLRLHPYHHAERWADFEDRVKADHDLYALLEDDHVVPSDDSDDEETEVADVSFDILWATYRHHHHEEQAQRCTKRRHVEDHFVYQAVIEHLTQTGTFPPPDDVGAWTQWLNERPLL